MENNKPIVSKQTVIKRMLIVFLGSLVFAGFLIYITKLSVNLKAILIISVILLLMITIGGFIGYRHQSFFIEKKNIISVIFIIIGILMIIVNILRIILVEESKFSNYLSLGIGLMFILYGIYQIRKKSNI